MSLDLGDSGSRIGSDITLVDSPSVIDKLEREEKSAHDELTVTDQLSELNYLSWYYSVGQ